LLSGIITGVAGYSYASFFQKKENYIEREIYTQKIIALEAELKNTNQKFNTLESQLFIDKVVEAEKQTKVAVLESGLTLEKLQTFNNPTHLIKGTVLPAVQKPPVYDDVIKGEGVFDWGDT